jgi:hypothetical protein
MSETAQPTPEIAEKKSRGLGSYVLWAFVAVMVYVLSSGPYMRSPTTMFDKVYQPLWCVYSRWWYSPVLKPLTMYWHLWRPDLFDKDGDLQVEVYRR